MLLLVLQTMSDFTFVLGIAFTVFVTILYLQRLLQSKGKRYPKGPYGFPIVGHIVLFGTSPPKTFIKWWASYGDVFSIRLGSWNTVVVNGYNAVKTAAEHPDDAFSGRPNFISAEILYERINEDNFAFGKFTPVYLKQRKLISKALRLFTSKRLEGIEELITSETNSLTDIMIEKNNKNSGSIELDVETLVARIMYQILNGKGNTVDVERHVKLILKTNEELIELTGSGNPLDVLPWLRYLMPWKVEQLRKCISRSDNIMKKEVQEHYETFASGNIRDLADAIISSDVDDEESKDRYVLTRARLNLTLSDLLAAGIDTTSKTLLWLFLYMAKFPQVQELVFTEIKDIVGTDRKVMVKDKPDLVYTNAVILEVMRIATLVPFSIPHYTIKNAKLQGYDIDKDTVVIFNLYSVHYEKAFWGDPENFRPERFVSDGKSLDKEKCNHVFAFSHGRRRCVGEFLAKINTFLSFSNVMQKCKFIKPVGEQLDLIPVPGGLNYTCKPYKVLVQERN